MEDLPIKYNPDMNPYCESVNYRRSNLGLYAIEFVRYITVSHYKNDHEPYIHYDMSGVQYVSFATLDDAIKFGESQASEFAIIKYKDSSYFSAEYVYRTPLLAKVVALQEDVWATKAANNLAEANKNKEWLAKQPKERELFKFSNGFRLVLTIGNRRIGYSNDLTTEGRTKLLNVEGAVCGSGYGCFIGDYTTRNGRIQKAKLTEYLRDGRGIDVEEIDRFIKAIPYFTGEIETVSGKYLGVGK